MTRCRTFLPAPAVVVVRRRIAGLALLLSLLATPLRAAGLADLVLRGAAVYTLDATRSWAQAVAVRDGRIAYVGTEPGAEAWIGPRTRVVDLRGRMLLPAFQDAHIHPVTSGVEAGLCVLTGLDRAEAIFAKVRACAAERPGEGWLVGTGWELPAFPGGAPTRALLDALVSDRPVYLEAADGHSAWLNTKGLERAGFARETPDPAGGRVEREADGTPAGTVREAAAFAARARVPQPDLDERVAGLERAQEQLLSHGITAVQEANGRRDELEAYREAERRGKLKLRVTVALATDPTRGAEQVDDLVAQRREFASERVHPIGAKIFADGVIEAHTAFMLAPYLDRPGERGIPFWDNARLRPLVARLAREDFDVHVHAIGDGAVRQALDAFEAARGAQSARGPRFEIAHLQVIDPADVPRFRQLGVFAVFQPLWAFADRYVTEMAWPALGPERSRSMYPLGSVVRAGGRLAFGSDWAVSSLDPLQAMQVAVTRRAYDGRPGEVMQPEERIDLPTALAAYTIGAAAANGLEAETGSIEVGKRADLVVLSDDLFARPAAEIAQARVLLTLVDGQPAYRDPALAW